MADNWTPYTLEQGAEAYYLERLGTRIIKGLRELGMPESTQFIHLLTPTLKEMADGMYTRTAIEKTSVKPSGELDLVDSFGDV